MELRRTNYLFFVRAIKGGSLVKCMNVDTRGRPRLKYKEIEEIYNLRDAVYPNQVPKIHLRDDLQSSPTKLYAGKAESPDSSLVRGTKVKSEPEDSDFYYKHDGGEESNDLDDLSFGNMTLKQIKKRCKTKKRKYLSFVSLNKNTVEICSGDKQELPNFQHMVDEYDLEEPLISWKSKLSKIKKSKKKSSKERASASSRNALSIIKSEQVYYDEHLMQANGYWPAPINVKVKVPRPGYTNCQTTSSVTSVFSCSEQVDTVSSEVPETTNVHTNEPQYCPVNEVSNEFQEKVEPRFDEEVSSWEIVKVDSPVLIDYEYSELSEFMTEDYIIHPLSNDASSEPMSPTEEYSCDIHDHRQSDSNMQEKPWQTCNYSLIQIPETTIACCLETGAALYPREEPPCCFSNGVSSESIEDVNSKCAPGISGWEIVKVCSPETVNYQCAGLQEFEKESYAAYLLTSDGSSESLSPSKDHNPDLDDSFKNNSSELNMAWQSSNSDQIEVTKMNIDNSLRCSENINEGSACSSKSRSRQDWPSNVRNISITPSIDNELYWRSSCLNSERHSVTISGHSPSAAVQSQLPASIATNDDASDKPIASARSQDYHHMKQQQHCPERLLSSRKAISPTSQERLCRAMESTGLDENEHLECRGKLYFGKHTNHRILRAQALDQFRRDGATIKPNSLMRTAKQDNKGSPPKGILKITRPSRSVPCNTVQRCSQNAIAFTQRQLQDIESIASKLTTELKSIKEIVQRKLHLESEASTEEDAKENADKVRMAIENATKAEDTAKKWLAIMAKDCNRFCKIMKLAEENTVASERVIHKERKITFADEAGGKLCHVKVFKDDIGMASLPEAGIAKQTDG